MSIFHKKHGHDGKDEKTITEGIIEAETVPAEERLRQEPPSEPGKPDAVNLERREPVTNAARRRDAF